jgi:hypothetical protein
VAAAGSCPAAVCSLSPPAGKRAGRPAGPAGGGAQACSWAGKLSAAVCRWQQPCGAAAVRLAEGRTCRLLLSYLHTGAGFEEARARVVATLQKPAHGGNGEMLDFGLLLATARAP